MPAPAPDFFYGPVALRVTKTNSYSRSPVYSEDKTDYLYDHVVIDINAIYNPQATAYAENADPTVYNPVATPGTLPPDTDLAIHTALMTPRQLLVYSPGGSSASIIVHSPDGNDTVDAMGGPKPISCTVREIAGSKTWLVNYRIETWLKDCPNTSVVNPLISNRWETTHSIDDQYMTTISYSGHAHFRVNILEKAKQVADAFRSSCLPPVPANFRRVKVDIVAVPNRASLAWRCVDQEQFYNLGETDPRQNGSGVTKVDATYSVSSISAEGGVVGSHTIEQIDVRVEGSKLSLPWGLTQFAILLANVKLPIFNLGVTMQHAAIRQSMTDRWVELQMAVRVTAPQGAKFAIIDTSRLRQDPPFLDQGGVNPALPNDAGTRGTYNHVAMTQAFQAACQPVKLPLEGPVAGGSTNAIVSAAPPVAVTVTVADVLPDHPVAVSAAATGGIYSDYKVDLKFHKKPYVVQAPVAGPAGTPCEFMTLAAPTSTLLADWTVEHAGGRPILPAPVSTDPNLVLLDSEQTNAAPVLTPDGATKAWRMSGRYTYGMGVAMGPGDALACGALPWMAATFNENVIDPADYQQGIISSGQSGSQKVGPQT